MCTPTHMENWIVWGKKIPPTASYISTFRRSRFSSHFYVNVDSVSKVMHNLMSLLCTILSLS